MYIFGLQISSSCESEAYVQHELRALRQIREALEDQLERISAQPTNGSAADEGSPSKDELEKQRKEVNIALHLLCAHMHDKHSHNLV